MTYGVSVQDTILFNATGACQRDAFVINLRRLTREPDLSLSGPQIHERRLITMDKQ